MRDKNTKPLLSLIRSETIILTLKGKTKETVIGELLDILTAQGKLSGRAAVLKDLLDREQAMSTAIPNGIALPHAKTNAVKELSVAIGIKKSGLDFDSPLDDKTNGKRQGIPALPGYGGKEKEGRTLYASDSLGAEDRPFGAAAPERTGDSGENGDNGKHREIGAKKRLRQTGDSFKTESGGTGFGEGGRL
jgi:hypothetical protein